MAETEVIAPEELQVEKADLSPTEDSNVGIEQLAYLIYLQRAKQLKDELQKEVMSLYERRERLKFLHGIMQEINNALNDKGELDLKKNPSLLEKLHKAKDMGIKLVVGEKQEKFNSFEAKRLLDNLGMEATDLETDNGMQVRKMENLYKECEQTIMLAKSAMSALDKPKRAMMQGMRGG